MKPNFIVERGINLAEFLRNLEEKNNSIINSHFQYVEKLDKEERFLIGGPCLDVSKFVFIIKSDSLGETTELVNNDPTIKSDYFKISSSSEFIPSVGDCVK